MNILHVIDTTGPGGAETIYTHLACKLNNNGYNSTAVIRGRGWVYDTLVKCGIEPIIVDSNGKFNYRYIGAIVKIVREKKIDLIHSHLLGANVYMSI
ncbi:MAG: glycosyltransferase, partial [Bacteroidetes bacterium]|nr:glycosyltransferase [Bacteroidota bacterium]